MHLWNLKHHELCFLISFQSYFLGDLSTSCIPGVPCILHVLHRIWFGWVLVLAGGGGLVSRWCIAPLQPLCPIYGTPLLHCISATCTPPSTTSKPVSESPTLIACCYPFVPPNPPTEFHAQCALSADYAKGILNVNFRLNFAGTLCRYAFSVEQASVNSPHGTLWQEGMVWNRSGVMCAEWHGITSG